MKVYLPCAFLSCLVYLCEHMASVMFLCHGFLFVSVCQVSFSCLSSWLCPLGTFLLVNLPHLLSFVTFLISFPI